MKLNVSRAAPERFSADIISIGLFERADGDEGARHALIKHVDGGTALDKALSGSISRQIAQERFKGERGAHRMLFTAGQIPAKFILLVGMGKRKELTLEVLRESGAAIAKAAKVVKAQSAALVLERGSVDDLPASDRGRAIVEGAILGSYAFERYKTDGEERPAPLAQLDILYRGDAAPLKAAMERGRVVAEAQNAARDLTNTPAQDATPAIIARSARRAAQKYRLGFKSLSMAAMAREGMGALMAVARGSAEPPAFIVLSYRPKGRPHGRLALVGKGVTFDSGGISIKPARGMETMKGDMAGAASVIAAMQAIAQLKPAVEVHAYIPAAENMPDGKAVKPGDIVTARNGKTIEITNTDAEGRLIVADALSYAADRKPDAIVELSTLTGGAAYCCGELFSIAVGTDQKLIDRVRRASEATGERMWQLPMVDEYKKGYTSGIADLNNTGKSKAQTIMGGIFLKEFVGEVPFAHMDIAASAWADEDRPLWPRGATGVMVRTLVEFVSNFRKG
ncbi:MAG: leucyl aminopeptidase [Proteobacteria bacterium]|nr:leucyl aminopeptidase [Pseudomonadota bacterium]